MDGIRAYLLSVVAAAIISALAVNIIDKKGAHSTVIKLLAGLFLSIIVISPWTKIRLNNISSYFETFKAHADDAVLVGTSTAETALDEIIKERTQAYILDKAVSYGANIEVEVMLSETPPKVPMRVILRGSVAPYVKQRLQIVMEDDLAIPKESQFWE